MTLLCDIIGHKMRFMHDPRAKDSKGRWCVRCWPEGVPDDVLESLLNLYRVLEKYSGASVSIDIPRKTLEES